MRFGNSVATFGSYISVIGLVVFFYVVYLVFTDEDAVVENQENLL